MTEKEHQGLTMPVERLEELMREQWQLLSQHLLEERPKSVMPALLLVLKDSPEAEEERVLLALAVPFNEDEEKRPLLRRIGQQVHEARQFPVAALLTSEAWVAPEQTPHVQPRDNPERREALIFCGSTLNFESRLLTVPVRRDAEDRMIQDGEPEMLQAEARLLAQFFTGFFEKTARDHGMDLAGGILLKGKQGESR
jgi:hypothetical protein